MEEIINIKSILKLIPHRYPLLLVDRIIELKKDEHIVGIKNVTFNEPHFMGHFPGNPIMPGVLVVEALAQISAILVAKSLGISSEKNDSEVYFMSIEKAKFRKIIQPGDSLILKSSIIQNRGKVWKFESKAYVEEKVVAESNFTAMVQYKN